MYFDPAGPEKDAWCEQGCDLERKSEPSSQPLEPENKKFVFLHRVSADVVFPLKAFAAVNI